MPAEPANPSGADERRLGAALASHKPMSAHLRISIENVLNTFPWPDPTAKQRVAVEDAAGAVLAARAAHPESTLADLYDIGAMPRDLSKAHDALDRAVDAAYSSKSFFGDLERMSFIFNRYAEVSGLMAARMSAS